MYFVNKIFYIFIKLFLLPYRFWFNYVVLNNPYFFQKTLSKKIFKDLNNTEYANSFTNSKILTYEDYSKNIPICDYENIRTFINKQETQPNKKIISKQKILFFETTSGSSGWKKRIPYTKGLKKIFYKMFLMWLSDLLCKNLRFRTFKTYMSISPQFIDKNIQAILNTNQKDIQDDLDYIEGFFKPLIKKYILFIPNINKLKTSEEFYKKLAHLFLSNPELEIISVWSPSFLLVLFNYIENNQILFKKYFKLNKLSGQIQWNQYWPNLQLISCWGDGHAQNDYEKLINIFPNVYVQKKGLLATEAPMTIPYGSESQQVTLPNLIFYEFLDKNGNIFLLHELKLNESYEIIISNFSALYRYKLNDKIIVTGFNKKTPCIKYLGRTNRVVDLVGEKIAESQIISSVEACFVNFNNYFIALPIQNLSSNKNQRPYYLLLIDSTLSLELKDEIEKKLDSYLGQNPHYSNARKLKQLECVKIKKITNLKKHYISFEISSGKILGDIKAPNLILSPEQSSKFLSVLQALN